MTKWTSLAMAAVAATSAAFAFLPYGWAHVLAGSLSTGLGALYAAPTAHAIASRVRRTKV